ncbi:5780_t:CDS:2, partial [Funneliformis caledonium]
MSTYSQNEKKLLYSKWCEKFDLARHSLLAIFERQDGIQEVKPSLHISTQRYLQSTVNVPVNIITGVGFGAVACDGPGIGDYQVAIPTNLLFNGARVPND